MKRRHLLMATALAGAAWLAFFGDKAPATDIAEPVIRSSSSAARSAAPNSPLPDIRRASSSETASSIHILALEPRDTLIGGAHADTGQAPPLFASQSWMPPPPPPPKPPPPPPPTAPPVPFTYIGKMEHDNTWEIYLARGDKTYIVHDQTVIDGTYRVDSVKPPTLSLTYLPLKQAQTLTIGGTD
jgi:hypothetical protein